MAGGGLLQAALPDALVARKVVGKAQHGDERLVEQVLRRGRRVGGQCAELLEASPDVLRLAEQRGGAPISAAAAATPASAVGVMTPLLPCA